MSKTAEIIANTQAPLETEVALLKHLTASIKEKQDSHHDHFKLIHNDMGMLRLDMKELTTQQTFIISEQRDIKEVIKELKKVIQGCTHAFAASEKERITHNALLQKIVVEKDTAISTISIVGKVVLWIGGVVGMMYGAMKVIETWVIQ